MAKNINKFLCANKLCHTLRTIMNFKIIKTAIYFFFPSSLIPIWLNIMKSTEMHFSQSRHVKTYHLIANYSTAIKQEIIKEIYFM